MKPLNELFTLHVDRCLLHLQDPNKTLLISECGHDTGFKYHFQPVPYKKNRVYTLKI